MPRARCLRFVGSITAANNRHKSLGSQAAHDMGRAFLVKRANKKLLIPKSGFNAAVVQLFGNERQCTVAKSEHIR